MRLTSFAGADDYERLREHSCRPHVCQRCASLTLAFAYGLLCLHNQLTMLYILFGGTDVGSNLATVYGFSGIFFYFLFIVFASMLLMNMLLAILVDAYIAVKTRSFKERGVFKDMCVNK